jgi:hypothetical protein
MLHNVLLVPIKKRPRIIMSMMSCSTWRDTRCGPKVGSKRGRSDQVPIRSWGSPRRRVLTCL